MRASSGLMRWVWVCLVVIPMAFAGCRVDDGGGNGNDNNTNTNDNNTNTNDNNVNDNNANDNEEGTDGAAVFAADCAVCHGEGGSGISGPDIRDLTAEDITTGLESASHQAIALTDEEITAIADFLAE